MNYKDMFLDGVTFLSGDARKCSLRATAQNGEENALRLRKSLKRMSKLIAEELKDEAQTNPEKDELDVKLETVLSGMTNMLNISDLGKGSSSKHYGISADEITTQIEDAFDAILKLRKERDEYLRLVERTKTEYLESTLRVTNDLLSSITKHREETLELQKEIKKYKNMSKATVEGFGIDTFLDHDRNKDKTETLRQNYENIKNENEALRERIDHDRNKDQTETQKQNYENMKNENEALRESMRELKDNLDKGEEMLSDINIQQESREDDAEKGPATLLLTKIKKLKEDLESAKELNEDLNSDIDEMKKVIVVVRRVSVGVYDSKQMHSFMFQGLSASQKELVETIMNLKREHHQLATTFDKIIKKKKNSKIRLLGAPE